MRRKALRRTSRSGSRSSGADEPVRTDLFIGNAWRPAASGKRYGVINPATEECLAQVAEGDAADIDVAVQSARTCFDSKDWQGLSPRKRGALLFRLAGLLEPRAKDFAELGTRNNGKPRFESKIDIAMPGPHYPYYGRGAGKLRGGTVRGARRFVAE